MTATNRPSLEYIRTFGGISGQPFGRGFADPVDLEFTRDGRILVLNRGPMVLGLTRVGVYDWDEEFLYEFSSHGDAEGQLTLPTGIALDSRERVYIADEYNHLVSVFDLSGRFLGRWGEHGSGEGQMDGPAGLAFDAEDNLYVVDQHNHRVHRFTSEGRHLASFGEHGSGEGQLDMPWGVTLDPEGNVWVADWRNDRVQKFGPQGNFLASYGEPGDGEGQLNRPSSVAVDSEGYVYVADRGNERVQMLGPDGGHLVTLRGQATLSKWSREFLEANPDEAGPRSTSNLTPDLPPQFDTPSLVSWQTEELFWGPTSVNLDNEGRLFVTEVSRHRLQIYRRV